MEIMKEFRKRRGISFILFGILFVCMSFQYFNDIIIMTGLLIAGLIFLLRGIVIVFKKGKIIERDERTILIGGKASAYSWFLTLLVISFVFWIDYLELYVFSVRDVVMIVLFCLIFGFAFFKWGFEKKGDF